MGSKSEKIGKMTDLLGLSYPDLHVEPGSNEQNEPYLHIWSPTHASNPGITYLPNFHIITDGVQLSLVTFHGRQVDKLDYVSHSDSLLEIRQFLDNFSKGISLCKGIPYESVKKFDRIKLQDCLIECLNNAFVVRSLKCCFALKDGNTQYICDECDSWLSFNQKPMANLDEIKMEPICEVQGIQAMKSEEEDPDFDFEPFDDEDDIDMDDDSKYININGEMVKLENIKDYAAAIKPPVDDATKPIKRRKRGRPIKIKKPNDDDDSDEDYNPGAVVKRGRGRPKKIFNDVSSSSGDEYLPVVKRGRPYKAEQDVNNVQYEKSPKVNKQANKSSLVSTRKEFNKTCKVCRHTYRMEHNYQEDQAKHEKFFDLKCNVTCPLCSLTMAKLELTDHFESCHSTDTQKQTCCCECLEVMPNELDRLKYHIARMHCQPMCHTCGKQFTNKFSMDIHIQNFHSEKKDLFCDRCGKAFGHYVSLQKHIGRSCATGVWPCPLCEKTFTCMDKLRLHLAVHGKYKPYKCKFCDYRSYKPDNVYNAHARKLHNIRGTIQDVTVLQDELKLMQDFQKHHISKCDMYQKKQQEKEEQKSVQKVVKRQKKVNQVRMRKERELSSLDLIKAITCHMCGQKYMNEETIRRHFFIHSNVKPYKCRHCDYSSYKGYNVFAAHYSKTHGKGSVGAHSDCLIDENELESMKKFADSQMKHIIVSND